LGRSSPLTTPTPDAVAIVPPGSVITVTATPAAPGQRPITAATPAPPADATSIFRSIAGGIVAALMVGGIAGGVVLFSAAGRACWPGSASGIPGPPKYDLVDDPPSTRRRRLRFFDKPNTPHSNSTRRQR
jgi:hypothetical protein